MNFKDVEGQLARWLQKLQQYDFVVAHRPRKNHLNADALSRRPCFSSDCQYCLKLDQKNEIEMAENEDEFKGIRICVASLVSRTGMLDDVPVLPNLERVQKEDDGIRPILEWLTGNSEPQIGPTWLHLTK